jgi:hypothetical protein
VKRRISFYWGIAVVSITLGCGVASDGELGHVEQAVGTCNASNIATLKSCLANLATYDTIAFTADITCTGTDCCGVDLGYNRSLIQIISQFSKTIEGNGHTLTRQDMQRSCGAVYVAGTSNTITIRNLTIDDYANDTDLEGKPCPSEADGEILCGRTSPEACVLADTNHYCVDTIRLNAPAANITMDHLTIRNAKATAVAVWNRDLLSDGGTVWAPVNFSFTSSQILGAGALGIGIGPNLTPSDSIPSRVTISDSIFTDIRVNALAIGSMVGTSTSRNQITNNTFYNNHTHGLYTCCETGQTWPACDICGGGQVYLGALNYTNVQNNTIRDGYCDNCLLNGTAKNPHTVDAIELGLSDPTCGTNCVHDVTITNNTIRNNHRVAVYLNAGTTLTSTTTITNNTVTNNQAFLAALGNVGSAVVSPNTVRDVKLEFGFEGDPSVPWVLEPGWTQGVVCGTLDFTTGTHAVRWCDPWVIGPMEGHCVLRMMTATITNCPTTDYRGLWVRSPAATVPAGKQIFVDTWSRNGGVWFGRYCLEFYSASNALLGQACPSMNYDTWVYNPDPPLQWFAPAGATSAKIRYILTSSNGFADIDHTRLTW